MLSISVDSLGAYILSIIVLALIGASFYCDYVDGRYYAKQCMQFLFYCTKCNNIYSSNDEKEYCECPKCHVKNVRLKF